MNLGILGAFRFLHRRNTADENIYSPDTDTSIMNRLRNLLDPANAKTLADSEARFQHNRRVLAGSADLQDVQSNAQKARTLSQVTGQGHEIQHLSGRHTQSKKRGKIFEDLTDPFGFVDKLMIDVSQTQSHKQPFGAPNRHLPQPIRQPAGNGGSAAGVPTQNDKASTLLELIARRDKNIFSLQKIKREDSIQNSRMLPKIGPDVIIPKADAGKIIPEAGQANISTKVESTKMAIESDKTKKYWMTTRRS